MKWAAFEASTMKQSKDEKSWRWMPTFIGISIILLNSETDIEPGNDTVPPNSNHTLMLQCDNIVRLEAVTSLVRSGQ